MEDLFENKDFREQMASAYLASVTQKDFEFTKTNLHSLKFAVCILLNESTD